ncbi:MAG TPA: alpha/beta fold hydrolase [Burkholderiaceae bacterium]|nr:alpha/beta fold hydrolase [Burkholderiaceae bacterium]
MAAEAQQGLMHDVCLSVDEAIDMQVESFRNEAVVGNGAIRLSLLLLLLIGASVVVRAQADNGATGVVLLHGKQSNPGRMLGLAHDLRQAGYKVATPEMAWSQRREMDVSYPQALAEIEAVARSLAAEGAKRIVVGGHSLGANAAIAYAGSGRAVHAVFALAPGHIPGAGNFGRAVAPGVEKAREMIKRGQGEEKSWFPDFNQGQGRQIHTAAATYLTYFDPEGIGVMARSIAAIPRPLPIFMAVGVSDSIACCAETAIYNMAPKHGMSQYVAVQADHDSTIRVAAPALLEWLKTLPP